MPTKRQTEILNSIVEDYIATAQPVSSQLIEKKYSFGICPATIRIEMQKLTDENYLAQPHTSAGRVPTDKGYRFFVDSILKEGINESGDSEIKFEGMIENPLNFLQMVTKNLASASSNFALGYLSEEGVSWKEGWEDILQEPEFKEIEFVSNFAELIKHFESGIEDLRIDSGIEIYIGRENPFPKSKDFSTIISRCYFPGKREGILAILGPKRMPYERNIHSLDHFTRLLAEL